MKKKCCFNEKVYLYFNDELNEKEKDELIKHLEICRECKEEYNIMRQMKNELSNLEEIELPKDFNSKLHKKLVSLSNNEKTISFGNYLNIINKYIPVIAAVVVISVITGGYFMYKTETNLSKRIGELSKGSGIRTEFSSEENSTTNSITRSPFALIPQDNKMNSETENKEQTKNIPVQEENDKMSAIKGSDSIETDAKVNNTQPTENRQMLKNTQPTENLQPSKAADTEDIKQRNTIQITPIKEPKYDVVQGITKGVASVGETNITCETVIIGNYSNHIEKGNYVIKNNDDFKKLWYENIDNKTMPEIDFSKYMIIAVFQGTKSTGGYNIIITSVTENMDNIEVNIEETEPAPDCMTAEVITSPFHIVKIKKVDKEVIFK